MSPARVIDLRDRQSTVIDIIKPGYIKIVTKSGSCRMMLARGKWLIEDRVHPMTRWQKILYIFGFYKERHFARAARYR